jgi:hypothetical protein
MLAMALAYVIVFTGCDDVFAEIQKGLGAVNASAYGIVLSEAEADAFDSSGTKTLLVVNSGIKATGTLRAELTGESREAFVLSKTELPSIEAGDSGSFTVTPKTGLAVGTYTATVTVSGANNISASFGVSFTVEPTSVPNFAELVKRMAKDVADHVLEASYILPGFGGGEPPYTTALTLDPKHSPLKVTIDGGDGGWNVTGISSNVITVGMGVALTLTNITFAKIPFVIAMGGRLVLDNGAVIRGNTAGCWDMTNGEGAISVSGLFQMKDGSFVTNNCATGIELENNGTFSMEGGTISDNKGGGGWNGGVVIFGTKGKFIMSGGEISDNESAWGGGVVMYGNDGVFNMTSGTISGNKANAGGGVLLWSNANETFNMRGGVISGNTASADGGGVVVMPGSILNMTGGEISGNTAATKGGGVNLWGADRLTGDPWIGKDKTSGSGPGWIYGNTAIQNPATNDVSQ